MYLAIIVVVYAYVIISFVCAINFLLNATKLAMITLEWLLNETNIAQRSNSR